MVFQECVFTDPQIKIVVLSIVVSRTGHRSVSIVSRCGKLSLRSVAWPILMRSDFVMSPLETKGPSHRAHTNHPLLRACSRL